ncbi:Cytochrome c-type biogenesis protein Ccs1/ResB [Methylophaga thiooxydans]|uniref:Cytochrome c-type biogenesis protein Ccs1/ResB n=1 Tax=Methylophaga thiooxydans TaxID=392484 RepID=A0A0A0BFF2_9GAMM|nr:cytochrome c biogenesis protein ResB [Methylophaga thiooxydans]KGM05839.1 Cytochrome c-type biogenesis protein Ccs1/ResB [Methylophaga thiooxydans]
MSQTKDSQRPHHSFAWRLFHFLGTMELAITLLITLAIASVIGTVLQQNQPYPDYVIKFGPFWFEVFESLGLYDVYSALWFLIILTLLVMSTSVCVVRHAPSMFKDMFNLRTNVQLKSLRSMHHRAEWLENAGINITSANLQSFFKTKGFRTRLTEKGDDSLISAMRGGMNRLGYILTHVAIIVICVGGLMDSNLPLKLAEWQGRLKIETQNLPLSQIPQESRLPVGSQAFRGSVSIPEGRSSEVVYLPMRDGYLVQKLPFTIAVDEFRIEHYATGQPKSFESDLKVYDPDLAEPITTTISVNHPLIHKGYAIYQASFGDGGSELALEAWPLFADQGEAVTVETKVFETREMRWGEQQMLLEMTGFRPFNINPDPTEDDPKNVRNYGPSIQFKLRRETGEAFEYENYMLPVEREGREFFLSGVRSSPAEEFAYLYIPADENGELAGFIQFLQNINDKQRVEQIATQMKNETLLSLQTEDDQVLGQSLQKTLVTLVDMFIRGGFGEVRDFIEQTLPETERDSLAPAYLAMLREMLGRLYFEGLDLAADEMVDESELVFMQDAIDAIGTLPRYGSPVYLALKDYTHIESTGLQIARSPGKSVVYLGCAFLIAGVFLLFYLPQRRFWMWLKKDNQQTRVYLAGMSNRNPREFDSFFEQTRAELKAQAGNSVKS